MGSPITFSGFNKIDFNMILNAVMEQERQPLYTLTTQDNQLKAQSTGFSTLASKLAALESASKALSTSGAFAERTVTNTDPGAATIETSAATPFGTYDVLIKELARAQVTGTISTHTDKDTTIVANGGKLVIGGVDVEITGDVTLEGLANAINATEGIGVTATVVSPTAGTYQLVLTGNTTGEGNGYTIDDDLLGGSGLEFRDSNGDGISGDEDADNAVKAGNAEVVVNNITISSSSNTVESAVPGATLTLLRKDDTEAITVTVGSDPTATRGKLQKFVDAYNDLVRFITTETQSAAGGQTSSIGRDPLLRGLEPTFTAILGGRYGGAFDTLAAVGVEFSRSGELELKAETFDKALKDKPAGVSSLFTNSGVFGSLQKAVQEYTRAGGLIPDLQTRLSNQRTALGQRISDMEARLETRRLALQQEYIAADMAMSRLNQQMASLSSVGGAFRLF